MQLELEGFSLEREKKEREMRAAGGEGRVREE